MPITIRPARPEEVRPAFDLVLRVFMIYTAPLLEAKNVAYFQFTCVDEARLEKYISKQWRMIVALDGDALIGVTCERDDLHITTLYVDPSYHRQGVATALLNALITAMAVPCVTLNSSPYALPFYVKYGFVPTGKEHPSVKILTPMEYSLQ